MSHPRYDVVIIGAGTAGQSAYKQVVKYTSNILVINAGPWDTTCARVGCMPSKLLIEAAKYAHLSQHADEFGIHNQTRIDGKAVMQRVQQLRDYFTGHAQTLVDHWPAEHKLQGQAQFVDAQTLKVGEQTIHSNATIVATGSTPRIPEGWQDALKHKLLTSDTIFNLSELPKSIIVAGTGAIGIELAQALSQLGVEVTLIGTRQFIGGLTSPELTELATSLIGPALNYIDNSKIEQVYLQDNQVMLHYQQYQHQRQQHSGQIKADYLLAATGRESTITALGLDKINPRYADTEQIEQQPDTMQLDDLPIFLAGDVASKRAVQHEAAFAGRIAGINAAHYPKLQPFSPYAPLAIVFSSPQMAISGQSHQALTKANTPFVCAQVTYNKQGRATIQAKNHGAIELYGCPTSHKLLGAELLVHEAEHLAHLLTWSIQQGLTVTELLAMPFYHPVLEEGLRTALVRLNQQLAAKTPV